MTCILTMTPEFLKTISHLWADSCFLISYHHVHSHTSGRTPYLDDLPSNIQLSDLLDSSHITLPFIPVCIPLKCKTRIAPDQL